MKTLNLILSAALLAVLAGCAAPAKPNEEQQRKFEREMGEAVRAKYWTIQQRQQLPSLKP